jgi:arsenate reductase-like glutaredoxin family protein
MRWGWLMVAVLLVAGLQNRDYLLHRWRHLTGHTVSATAAAADVTVYTYDNCGAACSDAIDFFRDADIRHTVINVSHDTAGQALVQAHGGGLPLITDGGRVYAGYDPYFLEQWYERRQDTARQLTELGLYAAGAPHSGVIIFGASWCHYCHLAEQYFRSHGIPYQSFDIEVSAAANAQERRLFDDNPLPGIVYADMLYAGYSEQRLDAQRKWIGDE